MINANLNNVALVTHRGCMDGSTCAIVFCAAGGLRENIFFTSPNHRETNEIVSDLLEHWSGPIIIADASISMFLAEKVHRLDVVLLDHHKTAASLAKFSWCEIDIDNTRAGGKMLFDWLIKNFTTMSLVPYKGLVDLADDHDRWIKQYKESDILSVFHEALGQDLFIDRFLKNPETILTSSEQYVVNLEIYKRDQYIQNRIKHIEVVRKKIQGHDVNVGFVAAGAHQSLLGNTICESPELDVDMCVLVGSTVSLRSSRRCPVDLSIIAELNGGGGHHRAAGCAVDKLLGKSWLEYVKDNLKFE